MGAGGEGGAGGASRGSIRSTCDVAVVGGGLGGLAAAGLLARRGLDVLVLERASTLGGRAATKVRDGYFFNEGAHALYLGGAAARVLEQLGVSWTGKQPPVAGVAVNEGRAFGLPATVGSLLTTGLLGWSSKLQGARLFARLPGIDPAALAGVSWQTWAEQHVPDPAMRATLEAFVRVSTYANAPSLLSAGAVLQQLRLAQKPGVAYVDGGWATLVEGAAAAGGLAGRPGPRVPDAPGVFVVGDWVGPEGMLLDASLASAERAAMELAGDLAVAKVA